MPGAGLVGEDRGVGHQVHGGVQDPGGVLVEDERAVHLRELAQPGGGERDVEEEAARRDRVDGLVAAEHEQRAGAAAQDALEAVAQDGAGRDAAPASPAAGALRPCGRSLPRVPVVIRCGARGQTMPERWTSGLGAVHLEQRLRVAHPEVEHPQRGVDVGDADDLETVDVAHHAGVAVRLRRHDRASEPEPGGLGQPLRDVADPAQLAGEADLADRDQVGGDVALLPRRRDGDRGREVGGGLGDAHPADGGGEHVVGVQPDPGTLLEHRDEHRDPGAVETRRGAPRSLGRSRR